MEERLVDVVGEGVRGGVGEGGEPSQNNNNHQNHINIIYGKQNFSS